MNFSISNIAWAEKDDEIVYKLMKQYGFTGLEIAPTRFFSQNPYEHLAEARALTGKLSSEKGLEISSLQSILFGRNERIFENSEQREFIIDYLFKAIDFAAVMQCKNLVFGSPRNRFINGPEDYRIAVEFFETLGDYAYKNGTIISIEANPAIYGTNFINNTNEAVEIAKDVNSKGFKVNLDIGTVLINGEDIKKIRDLFEYVNHVHISEPDLLPIESREEHKTLVDLCREKGFEGFISIEMKKSEEHNLENIEKAMQYICEVFQAIR